MKSKDILELFENFFSEIKSIDLECSSNDHYTISEVMKWAERKQSELSQGQKLIVLSMFKI